LRRKIILNEGTTIEFKRKFTSAINKTIIVFANTKGGTLYTRADSVAGVDDIDGTLLKITNTVRDSILKQRLY